jgi:hypothetical protein
MMTNRTARGNRVGLAVTGLVLLTAGGYVLARSLGAFGSTQARQPVYTDAEAGWIRTTIWIWPAVAAVGVMIAILALRWLIVQLRTERLNSAHREHRPQRTRHRRRRRRTHRPPGQARCPPRSVRKSRPNPEFAPTPT